MSILKDYSSVIMEFVQGELDKELEGVEVAEVDVDIINKTVEVVLYDTEEDLETLFKINFKRDLVSYNIKDIPALDGIIENVVKATEKEFRNKI